MDRKDATQLELPDEFKEVTTTLLRLFPEVGRNRIGRAIEFTYERTRSQKRLNGEPQFIHPLMVALKTAQMGLGPNSISAALLHDLIGDRDNPELISKEILAKFGEDIHTLVLALTQMQSETVERSPTSDPLAAQLFLLSTIDDLRVIMIKLADKLHNLKTIEGLAPKRQERFMQEIEQIYLSIAEYIGLGAIHREMADLLFAKRHPEEYDEIVSAIQNLSEQEEDVRNKIIEELRSICDIAEVETEIEGRLKSITSINRKRKRYEEKQWGNSIERVKDIIAFRILCDTTDQCFLISSSLQQFFDLGPPIDDYISSPKPNGYRSIHLVLIHPEFGTFEVQIKTYEMHEYNEYGPASHIAYKVSGRSEAKATDEYSWVKNLSFSSHFYEKCEDRPIPTEILTDSIFVLTPKHDFIRLPKGSTPIDFAYSLHSDLGNQCIGASVNQRLVTIDTKLKTGDIVEVQTNPKKKYASESWLDFVVTDRAEEMIRRSLRRRMTRIK